MAGQAPFEVGQHNSLFGLVAECIESTERYRVGLHPKNTTFKYLHATGTSNLGWGAGLNQVSVKDLCSNLEKVYT